MDESVSFGPWLKRRRKSLDLTQQALAERVGCSVVSIRKFEQETQRPSRALAARLAEQVHIPPDEQQDFIAFARFGTAPSPVSMPNLSHQPVPPWQSLSYSNPHGFSSWSVPHTTLVGRSQECAAVREAVLRPQVRVLTLTGPGGVGKTRLAATVAADVASAFANGVCSINLAPIHDPAIVASAIAHALGIEETGAVPLVTRLCAFLHDKQMLVLLDNFEQVLEAAPLVATLRTAAPLCTFLLTSRARLALSGEVEISVLPLPAPIPDPDSTLAALVQNSAVQLFIERAQAVQPGFMASDADARAIAAICHRLDGLPLAIELAAARAHVLSPSLLLQRLEQRLPLLTGGARDLPERHHTLRNTIAWGYELLESSVQALFRRLAVFQDGWTLEAAEAVCTLNGKPSLEVLEGLVALLDHNMIMQLAGPTPNARFTMLQTLHEFATAQFQASDEVGRVCTAHASYFLSLAERAEHAEGGDQFAWFTRLEYDHANLRAALEYGPLEVRARLSAALADFWALRDQQQEGERWLESLVHRDAGLPPSVQARVRVALARVVYRRGDRMRERPTAVLGRVQHLLEESLELSAPSDDQRAVADARIRLGEVLCAQGQLAQAQAHFEMSVSIAEQERAPRLRTWAFLGMAMVAARQHVWLRAGELATEALTLSRALGETHGCAFALLILARAAEATGSYSLAEQRHVERLAYERMLGHQEGIALTLMDLTNVVVQRGNMAEATKHAVESLRVWRELGAYDRIMQVAERVAEIADIRGQPERAAQLREMLRMLQTAFTVVMQEEDLSVRSHDADVVRVEASLQALLERFMNEMALLVD